MASNVPQYPPFDVKGESLAISWKKWSERLDLYFEGYEITAPARKRALLLTFGGGGLCDLVDSLPQDKFTVTEAERAAGLDTYTKTVRSLSEHFSPQVNIEIQRFKFHECRQTEDTLQEYYEHLSCLADTCRFADKDSEIKSRIIRGCKSKKLKLKGFHNANMTLTELLEHGRAQEIAEKSAKEMLEAEQSCVDAVKKFAKNKGQGQGRKETCGACGYVLPHRGDRCPAKGQACNNCSRLNHFASMCDAPKSDKRPGKKFGKRDKRKLNKVQAVEVDKEDEFFLGSIDNKDVRPWMTKIEITKML